MEFEYTQILSEVGERAVDIGDSIFDYLTPEVDEDNPAYSEKGRYAEDRLDVVSKEELRERRRKVEEMLDLEHEDYLTLND